MCVDDLLYFGRVNFCEVYELQNLINQYSLASHQTINTNQLQLIHHKSLHVKFQSWLVFKTPCTTNFSMLKPSTP